MSGWHPQAKDGGIPPNPSLPTSPAQAYAPAVMPIDTDALYYGNGCDVRLRPHVLNSLISEGLALLDRVGLAYRPAQLTNLRTGVEYMIQQGRPKFAVVTPQASPAHMYLGTLDPPVRGLNNGMMLCVLPTVPNSGLVRLDVGNGAWVPVRRNDSEELESGDWPTAIPQLISYYEGNWFQLAMLPSQVSRGGASGLVGIKVFETAGQGTYARPDHVRRLIVICTAAGGSASAPVGSLNNGSGGYSGGTAISFIDVSAITSIPYTVGAGGLRQTQRGYSGNQGGPSNFGTYAEATGGAGGQGQYGGGDREHGHGTIGDIKLHGNPGMNATGGGIPGFGGGSFLGGGGEGGRNVTPPVPGGPGHHGGGGGCDWGGTGSPIGYAGGDGCIILFELG